MLTRVPAIFRAADGCALGHSWRAPRHPPIQHKPFRAGATSGAWCAAGPQNRNICGMARP